MKEMIENDNELKRLLKEEGLLTTSPDFTNRVMQLVEESSIKADHDYKPLFNRKTWFFVAFFFIALLLFCIWVLGRDSKNDYDYLTMLKPATDLLKKLDFTMSLNSGALLIVTMVVASVGLLLFIDFLLNSQKKELSK